MHYVLQNVYKGRPGAQSSIAVSTFWIAYILTRPLGASIGDYLSQAPADGGLGLGTTFTSFIFLTAILGTVLYLILTKRDITERQIH